MKKHLKTGILILIGIAILYQAYIYLKPDELSSSSIPNIPLVLIDNTETSISYIGADKHTIIFLVSSQCDYCKKEINEVKKNIDRFVNTELVFISFEELNVISEFKNSIFPVESSFITFAQASREEVSPYLEYELVYPYMIWYDNNGLQKIQHRGLYPIERIIETIDKFN